MAGLDDALVDAELSIRPFEIDDRRAIIGGRDGEFHRFLGEGSPCPAPVACIWVDERIVGWIDFDQDRQWLATNEVNVGYGVFPEHRERGYGTRALTLLCGWLERRTPRLRPTLLIDPANRTSLALADRAGFEHVRIVDRAYLLALADRNDRAEVPQV